MKCEHKNVWISWDSNEKVFYCTNCGLKVTKYNKLKQ